jgi:hypothetical protein
MRGTYSISKAYVLLNNTSFDSGCAIMIMVAVRPPVGLVNRLRDCRPLAISTMRLLPPIGTVELSL